MMNTLLFIPSRSRANRLDKNVIVRLPQTLDHLVNLVVPSDQAPAYRRALFTVGRENITVLECPENGIAKTRQWIGQTAARLAQNKFIMMDDDLTDFATRIAPDDYHLRKSTHEDIVDMLIWVQTALDTYVHASVSPRGNNA